MPHESRSRLLNAAKVERRVGETVTLLVPPTPPDQFSTTPWDGISAQAPPDLSTYTRFPIYAFVMWADTGKLAYEEGGRVRTRKLTIEAQIVYQAQMQQASFVQLLDGSIFRKEHELITEGGDFYIIGCVGVDKVSM